MDEIQKVPLRDAIRRGLKENRVKLVSVAERLGVPLTTLQGWFDRNKYRRAELPLLLQIAGVIEEKDVEGDVEELVQRLQNDFSFGIVRRAPSHDGLGLQSKRDGLESLSQVVSKMERQTKRLIESGEFVLEVLRFFQAMRRGDRFYYIAHNKLPYEWETVRVNNDLKRALFRAAVENNCRFEYFLAVSSESHPDWCNVSREYLEAYFKRFKEALLESAERYRADLDLDLDQGVVDQRIEDNFQLHPVTKGQAGPFFLPEAKLALFSFDQIGTTGERIPKSGGFVYFPWQVTSGVHVAMSEELTQAALSWIFQFLQAEGIGEG